MAKETKSKSVEQLRTDLKKLKIEVKSGVEKNVSKIKQLKKEIARLLTKQSNGKK